MYVYVVICKTVCEHDCCDKNGMIYEIFDSKEKAEKYKKESGLISQFLQIKEYKVN